MLNFEELAKHNLGDFPFNYRPGAYHCLRKKELNDSTDEQALIPYFKHKLHIGIDLKGQPEHFEKVWLLLTKIFKEEAVYEVKLIDDDVCSETPDKVQNGKEATIYFVDRKFTQLSKEQFLETHIQVMRKIDARIEELGLPISVKPAEDQGTEELGCYSGAVFVAPSDHEDDRYIRGNQRESFSSPYSKNRPVALLDVDHTLLFDDRLNRTLLNSLKRRGIKDIYLFTDMTFKDHSIQDRLNLLNELKREGFTVHGSLTPNDLTWGSVPAEEALKLEHLKC